jgi:ABC-type spermidine/putrescine transport system permease subunit II
MTKNLIMTVILIALFVFPLMVLLFYTVSPGWTYPDLWPQKVRLDSFAYLISNRTKITVSLLSSLLYSLLTVLLTFCICLLPASVFARVTFRGKMILESMALAPALVPAITFSVGIHYLFIKIGAADRMIGIVLVLTIFSYPYMLRSLIAGFLAYGEEYDLCARNLGAPLSMRIWRVDIPLLLPAIVAGSTVVFLVAFSEYFLVFLIGGGTVPSYTGYLFPFLNSSDRSVAALLTLIFMVIPIMLFFIIDRSVDVIYKRRGMIQ